MRAKIVILGLACLLMVGSILSAWQSLFTEPCETVYIIMRDEMVIKHTSQHDAMIDISIGRLKEELEKIDRNIKDIVVVIHNHRMNKYFTRSDYKQYWAFKNYGFDGQFLLYCHRTNKTYDIEDKVK